MIKPTIERPSSVASVSSPCRSCCGPLLAVLLISLVVTNAEEVSNLTNVWPTANGRPLITTAVVSSTPSNLRIAYCLALVGAPTVAMAAQHLAAISLLRQTGTKKDVLSMQSPNSILRLGDALRTLDTKVVFVPHVEGKCRTSSSAEQTRFRFSFSFHILRVYEQTQYDKILYLDGDLAVRTPPDRLVEAWARQGTTELRTPTGCNRVPDQKHYNTGVWGITPSRDYAAGLYPWLAAGKFPCGIGFQTWVNIYGANNSWTKASLAWNLKADQGVSKCMRNLGLKEAHVVHWSGNRKPIGLRTDDPVEARALAAYQAAHLRWLTFLGAPATASETLAGEVPLLSPETPTEEAFPSSAASLPATYPPSPMDPARCATNPFLDTRIVGASAFEATEARAAHFYSFGIASLLTKRLNELTPIRWPERERDRLRYHVEASQPAGRARWDVMPVLGTCDRLELLRAGPAGTAARTRAASTRWTRRAWSSAWARTTSSASRARSSGAHAAELRSSIAPSRVRGCRPRWPRERASIGCASAAKTAGRRAGSS